MSLSRWQISALLLNALATPGCTQSAPSPPSASPKHDASSVAHQAKAPALQQKEVDQGVDGSSPPTPRLEQPDPENVVGGGTLRREVIRAVISRHAPQVQRCYERAIVKRQAVPSKVVFQWTITAKGTVAAVRQLSTNVPNKKVTSCLTRLIRRWRFPKPAGGGIVVVKYPFMVHLSGT